MIFKGKKLQEGINNMSKKKVIVYGIGKFYREMEEKINEMYEVVSKVDRNLNEQERIVSLDEALLKYYDEVIITIENIGVCFEVVAMLIEKYDIPSGKIKLGLNLKESEGSITWMFRQRKNNFKNE